MPKATSSDGTEINYSVAGPADAPTVILVQGALNDSVMLLPFVGLLSSQFEVVAYDRRGRGGTGGTVRPNGLDHERELDDLAAILASVRGHSYIFANCSGAAIALRAAAEGLPIKGMILYEPPYFMAEHRELSSDYRHRLRQAIQAGRRDEALHNFMVTAVQLPESHFDDVKNSPLWGSLLSMAPTLLYDDAWLGSGGLPLKDIERVRQPVRVIKGELSPPWAKATVDEIARLLACGESVSLPGHDHLLDPVAVAPLIADFVERHESPHGWLNSKTQRV